MAWLQSGWALHSLFCTLLLLISLLLLFLFLTRCFFQQLVLTSACDVSLLCLQFYGAIRGWKKGGGEASEQHVVLESWGEGGTKRGVWFLNHDSKVTYLSERKFMQFYSSSSILSPSLNHRWKMLTKYLQNYKNLDKTALVKTKTSCKVLTGKDKALTKICLFKKNKVFSLSMSTKVSLWQGMVEFYSANINWLKFCHLILANCLGCFHNWRGKT